MMVSCVLLCCAKFSQQRPACRHICAARPSGGKLVDPSITIPLRTRLPTVASVCATGAPKRRGFARLPAPAAEPVGVHACGVPDIAPAWFARRRRELQPSIPGGLVPKAHVGHWAIWPNVRLRGPTQGFPGHRSPRATRLRHTGVRRASCTPLSNHHYRSPGDCARSAVMRRARE